MAGIEVVRVTARCYLFELRATVEELRAVGAPDGERTRAQHMQLVVVAVAVRVACQLRHRETADRCIHLQVHGVRELRRVQRQRADACSFCAGDEVIAVVAFIGGDVERFAVELVGRDAVRLVHAENRPVADALARGASGVAIAGVQFVAEGHVVLQLQWLNGSEHRCGLVRKVQHAERVGFLQGDAC